MQDYRGGGLEGMADEPVKLLVATTLDAYKALLLLQASNCASEKYGYALLNVEDIFDQRPSASTLRELPPRS